RPAFTSHWYSGGMKPAAPEEYINDPAIKSADGKKRELPGSAVLWIGTKGKMLVQGDYADNPRLIPESFMKQAKLPDKWIPRSPGHMQEFVMAAKGEKPWDYPGSSFAAYAAPITEVLLIGAIAEKIGQVGFKIECDPVWRRIKTPEAIALTGREYRKGWELDT
ncbi:MAG: hypothetical protein JOZ57_10960, partial [Abitibacteriaceae bacterium]|nr:hypothetical protein [Abditibacteriaceae bacterium]